MAHDLWTYVVKQFSSGDHFEHEVHNRPEASSYMEGIEETIEQLPIEEALYRLPDMEELLRVIRGCGNDKAPDEDGLCAEAFKALVPNELDQTNFQITPKIFRSRGDAFLLLESLVHAKIAKKYPVAA